MKSLLIFALLAAQPTFEVVSIKPAPPNARGGGYNLSPGRLNGRNQSLRDMVKFAYNLHDYQVSGGAPWTANELFEVLATFPAATTNADRLLMMQSMLASRFALVVEHGSKEVSGDELIVGKKGPKLRKAEPGQSGMMMSRTATGQRLQATGATMSGFASLLADVLGQPVLDKTNLEGVYDFDLEWTPDDNPSKGGQPQPKPDTMGPSLVTALQETLGLALKPHKVTVEAITITQAEHPSAN